MRLANWIFRPGLAIERAKSFLPQLKQDRVVDRAAIEQGLYLILLGLLRKVVIADHLAGLQPGDIFTRPENYNTLERAVWLLVFAFVIYNDFAGYTSIVRGVSCFLGIQLSPNFRQPFFARTFSDFWVRWHISLSEWLRDYIFYPVRRSLIQAHASRWTAIILPPMVTLLASGFWHGASLAFLFWGFLHGLYLVFEQFLQQFHWLPKEGSKARLYSIFVFIMTTLAWIPFSTPSVRAALRYMLAFTDPDVEVMLVHNLWGPQAETMKGKNAIVVRTSRSGKLCTEFETFLYKHGADTFQDSAVRHDLLMGIGQKLPTVISVALAMTLEEHGITSEDISSHCTLTSLYPILAMARVHSQNPRTYAEILATSGDSRRIVQDFAKNLQQVIAMADGSRIQDLCALIDRNSEHLSREFLQARMLQAKAVDEVLGKMI